MNIKEIYNEIKEEQNQMSEALKEEKSSRMIKPFMLKDLKYNLSFCFIAWMLGYFVWSAKGEPSSLLVNTISMLMLIPMFYLLYDVFYVSYAKNPKNLSISYFLMNKNKLEEFDAQNRYDIASNEIVSNDFLKKIALNMEEAEFEILLKKCEGKITLNKIREYIDETQNLESKENNIKNLTKAIYTENKKISE